MDPLLEALTGVALLMNSVHDRIGLNEGLAAFPARNKLLITNKLRTTVSG